MKFNKIYNSILLEQSHLCDNVRRSLICEDVDWWGVLKGIVEAPANVVVGGIKSAYDNIKSAIKPEIKDVAPQIAKDDHFDKFMEELKKKNPDVFKVLEEKGLAKDPMKVAEILMAISSNQAIAKKNAELAKLQNDMAEKDKALKALQAEKDKAAAEAKSMTDEDWRPSKDEQTNEMYLAVKEILLKEGRKPEAIAKRWKKNEADGNVMTISKGKIKLTPLKEFEAKKEKYLKRANITNDDEEETKAYLNEELTAFYEDENVQKAICTLTHWKDDKYYTRTEKFIKRYEIIVITPEKKIKKFNLLRKQEAVEKANPEYFNGEGKFDASAAEKSAAKIVGVDEASEDAKEETKNTSKKNIRKFKEDCISYQKQLAAARIAKSCDNAGSDDCYLKGGATLYAWNGKAIDSFSDKEIDTSERIEDFRNFLNKDFENGNPAHPSSIIHVLTLLKNCEYAKDDTKKLCDNAIEAANKIMETWPDYKIDKNGTFENENVRKWMSELEDAK